MLRTGLLALVGLGVATGVQGQVVLADGLTLDFTGRAQVQFSTTSLDDDILPPGVTVPATVFETRRVRLGAEVVFQEWLSAEIEGDLGGAGARLTNGYVDVSLADAFVLRAGQFKKPFGLFELVSSTQILPIERSVRLRGLVDYLGALPGEAQYLLEAGQYLGRDIGVMAHGDLGPFAYAAGVFNGEGANAAETRDSKALAGRLALSAGALTVGAGGSRQPTGIAVSGGDEVVGTAWSLDAAYGAFRAPGPRFLAEVMGGDAPVFTTGSAPTMLGVQAAAGWFMPRGGRVEGLEPVLRASWGDPHRDVEEDEGLLVTPGLNLYFAGRNRLMLNADIYVPSQPALEPQYGFRTQLQVHF